MKGLTTAQAQERLAASGPNVLPEPKKATPVKLFARQFANPFIIILAVAAALALFLGSSIDAVFILAIIVLIGVVGFWQEFKAEQTINSLKAILRPTATVIRDGEEVRLPAREIVVGDAIVIQTGERIPADATLLEAHNLEVDESPLTGESFGVEKRVDDTEEKKVIFMGTTVVHGRGIAQVTTTGGATRFGKIVHSLKAIEEEVTPLEQQMTALGKRLAFIAVGIAVAITVLDFIKGRDFIETVLTNISVAVAVVPEGLPAVMTIALAVGAQRLARKKAAVRRMAAIESFGNAQVICTDKTGTLTTGEMDVEEAWLIDEKQQARLLEIMILCNTALVVEKKNHEKADFLGDPTEIALLVYAQRQKIDIEKYRASATSIHEFSFDQKRKTMSTVWQKDGEQIVLVKGAPEKILEKSTLSAQQRQTIESKMNTFTDRGLRVLAFASKKAPKKKNPKRDEIESGLTFVGLVGLLDPPRGEVVDAIASARAAGIRTVMVTGDHEKTARYVAEKVHLLEEGDEIFTGEKIAHLSEGQLIEVTKKARIFARTTPAQKLRIVKAYQAQELLTAVTGDGVNDAPALKQADVGIAMGKTGTDVARQAADIVLTDDNFATIIRAISEGRKISSNTKTAVKFLIMCNSCEIFTIVGAVSLGLFGPFAGLPIPLTAVQLLWTNLVTDGLPALALALERHGDHLHQQAQRRHRTFLPLRPLFLVGLVLGVVVVLFYLIAWKSGSLAYARTVAFTVLVLLQLGLALVIRGWTFPFWRNRFLLVTIGVSVIIQFAIVFSPPLQQIFHTVPLW